MRVATYNVSLGRRGPGVLLKGIMSEKDTQVLAVIEIIQKIRPDILLLNEFDVDFANLALIAFVNAVNSGAGAIVYPFYYATIGNEGVPTGLDLDGDGKDGEWADAFGFGRFPGSEGMALLSKFPIDEDAVRRFSDLRWRDLPDALLPVSANGAAFFSKTVRSEFRMSSKSHWDVPIKLPNGKQLSILVSHPSPPVFDGPENLNGLRNDAEIGFWVSYLDGWKFTDDEGLEAASNLTDFVLLGDLNNDPDDGEGLKSGIYELLTHERINDPLQQSKGAVLAAMRYGGANDTQIGNPALDTVEWDADIGNMRVDYALPSASLTVIDSGVFWPLPSSSNGYLIQDGRNGASNHRLVWVDISIDTGLGTMPSLVNKP